MDAIRVYLLDKDGESQYGLNWGQRVGREPNQAYLQLESAVYNSDFFPIKGTYFLVNTDDKDTFMMNRAQKTDTGTAIQTPENNSILGLYLRKRLGVAEGMEITKADILNYGRIEITFKKIDNRHYFLDFAQNWKSNDIPHIFKTYLLTIKRDVPYNVVESYVKKVESGVFTSFRTLYDEFTDSDFFHKHYTTKSGTMEHIIITSSQYRPYITAIKSKPFLLLAGISGTGKSRIVRELARACWNVDSDEYQAQKPRNFEMVQVKPNWHDSNELIGYVSRIDGVRYVVGPFLKFMVKAIQDPETPYFLCLDEMNLAPVEQYFAEYLSVVESRKRQDDGTIITDPIVDYSNTEEYKSLIDQLFPDDDELRKEYLTEDGGKRLSIPQNLIVVGTVNMDETTFSFSRKVLDRAMTIEMNEVNLNGGLNTRHEKIGKLGAAELIGTAVEGVDVYGTYKDVCDTAINYLQKVNERLEGTPFKIAYRTRNEFLLYVVNNLPYNKDIDGDELDEEYVIARALDEITNMKILSRIEGDESKVSETFLEELRTTIKDGLEDVYNYSFGPQETEDDYLSISLAKLDEMKKRLKSSGYTSFWS